MQTKKVVFGPKEDEVDFTKVGLFSNGPILVKEKDTIIGIVILDGQLFCIATPDNRIYIPEVSNNTFISEFLSKAHKQGYEFETIK